jgi:hypothetical protein
MTACINALGTTLTLTGSVYMVPAASKLEQVRLVLAIPSGTLLRVTSGYCTVSDCEVSGVVTEPAGLYRIRADLLIGGVDVFQGAESPFIDIS